MGGVEGVVVSGSTRVVGLLGFPVLHSLSPEMQNCAFRSLGLDFVYVPFCVEPSELGRATLALGPLGLTGVNVTIPHKMAIMQYLDEVSDEAGLVGAVNTVHVCDGRLKGYTTDGRGLLRSLSEEAGFTAAGKKVILLGAGGTARSVGVALASAGAREVIVAGRTPKRAEELAAFLQTKTGVRTGALPLADRELRSGVEDADLVLNTTPVGMYPDVEAPPPVDPRILPREALVCDLVYNPVETTLLASARRRGQRTLSGLGMLAYQGALSFEIWTGRPAPATLMKQVLERRLLTSR
ncbi:MAG: shikimate dehydrogenase [Firmicutes bacterium]|nr:shikimate dehydrogenase [Bacillota bacterium]